MIKDESSEAAKKKISRAKSSLQLDKKTDIVLSDARNAPDSKGAKIRPRMTVAERLSYFLGLN